MYRRMGRGCRGQRVQEDERCRGPRIDVPAAASGYGHTVAIPQFTAGYWGTVHLGAHSRVLGYCAPRGSQQGTGVLCTSGLIAARAAALSSGLIRARAAARACNRVGEPPDQPGTIPPTSCIMLLAYAESDSGGAGVQRCRKVPWGAAR